MKRRRSTSPLEEQANSGDEKPGTDGGRTGSDVDIERVRDGRLSTSAGGSTLLDRWLGRIRNVARDLRAAFHRRMHPYRRRRALRSLREVEAPSRILFVCHGNICRSPYAEGAFRRDLPAAFQGRIDCRSAGFIGPDRPSPSAARQAALERGVDLTDHRSRLLEPEVVRSSDLVFVMDGDQASAIRSRFRSVRVLLLGDLDTDNPDRRRIRDPVTQPPAVFREVYHRIDRCVSELVTVLEERHATG